jgi:hypothetical protein
MHVEDIVMHEELSATITSQIGFLFQQICIVLARVQYTRNGYEDIRDLRTQLYEYYGIVHPQDVYHERINTMSLVVFEDIRNICETFLTQNEKEEVFEYLNDMNRLILG